MHFNEFLDKHNQGQYKKGDIFWVSHVQMSYDSIDFDRNLKPIKVFYIPEKNISAFFKIKKDGTPSKVKVPIVSTVRQSCNLPFYVFETEEECRQYYVDEMKKSFLDINDKFDNYKEECRKALKRILNDLNEEIKTKE